MTDWLTLIISLPSANATARMRIWRALKTLGCGVLRDGVYLLPDSDNAALALARQANEIRIAGGMAQLLKLRATHPAQELEMRALFERSAAYAALALELEQLLGQLQQLPLAAAKRSLKRLTREHAALGAIDFFPSGAHAQTAQLLAQAGAQLAALEQPDEPHPGSGQIKKLLRADFQQRLWATRKGLWIDRMASAWLIRRFIDPGAQFLWLNTAQDCPGAALGFDFDGASFSHVGTRVTFEVLLASFSLDSAPALQRLAAVVHFLDVGGIPVAEASGLELVLKGMRGRCADDDALLNEASIIFDDLYLTYKNEESKDEQ